ncbi:MAG: sensor histidine kinase [Planctomycetota bacterium]
MVRHLKHWIRRTLMQRGESVVASSGLALAAVLLAGLGASGWWTLSIQKDARHKARQDEVNALAGLLQESAEAMLASDELSGLRRVVVSVARTQHLESCRVSLLDGGVVADGEPARIDVLTLPSRWPVGAGTPPLAVSEDGLGQTRRIKIAGRGEARLELRARPHAEQAAMSRAEAGVGFIGAATLIGLLLVYRRMRHRLMAIGTIRESLLALQKGELDEAALLVNRTLGAEAEAWNTLLSQRAESRQEAARQQSLEQLTRGSDRAGDLESIGDAMWVGLVVVDERGRVSYANGAAAVLLQQRREELVGAELRTVLDDEAVLAAVDRAVCNRGGTRSTIEMRRDENAGDGLLRVDVRGVRFAGRGQALLVIEDVTQQRVADEARNAFVAQATHELRAPLTNIRLYVNTAIEDGDQDPTIRGRSLNVINQEARRLERIVNDMLSVAEIEAGALELHLDDVRLDSVFADLRADYEPLAKDRSVDLRFDLPPKLPVMHGDRDKLVLALHNLLNNALKYTLEGGTVTVAVEATDEELSIRFADTGIGIEANDLDRIFDKFQRAKDPRVASISGTGLGLALVREIIVLHGGEIDVQSEVNEGSTFAVRLPLNAEAT